MTECLALSMRLAGVRTKQIATSISFVNVSFLVSRMSNMLQAPLLGAMVDASIRFNTAGQLELSFRYIIVAAFVGNLIGAILTPWMVGIFEEGIYVFEKLGSVPKLLLASFKPKNLLKIGKCFRLPSFRYFREIHWNNIPHLFLYMNVAMVGIYAVGVLASLFAGANLPDLRATAVQLSGIVNGMATIMLAIMVDPSGAHITDQAVRGIRPQSDVKTMVFFLVMGRLLATAILAQLIFMPSTKYIMFVAQWISSVFGY